MAETSGPSPAVLLLGGIAYGAALAVGLGGIFLARKHSTPGGIDGWLSRAHLPPMIAAALGEDGDAAAAAFERARKHLAAGRAELAAKRSAVSEIAAAMTEVSTGESLRAKVVGPARLVAYLAQDASTTRAELQQLQRDANLPLVVWPNPMPGAPSSTPLPIPTK